MSTTAPVALALPLRLTVTRHPDDSLHGRPYVTDATGAHVCEGFTGPGKPEALAALVERTNTAPALAALLRSAVGGVGYLARTAAKGERITPEQLAGWEQWERNARDELAKLEPRQRWSIRNSLGGEVGNVETSPDATPEDAVAAYAVQGRAPLAELRRIGYTAKRLDEGRA